MARDELGAEPGPWVWLAMGSAARREALPGSDRDSALVFHSDADGEARSWFARFAAFVDAGLDRAGFPPCPGGVLATSADWRLDADEWRAKARGLCAEPSEKAQLSLQCMCDARTVAGHSSLASAAEGAGWDALAAAPAARAAIAASAASARIPASPPRSREEEKEARAVLARLARSWVMVRLVRAAGTVERIRALSDAGAFSSADAEGYAEAWTDLLALGLCTKGTRADALARVALARAATMQRALSWDIAGFLATS
jgi:CBS domain-containing protein